MGAVLSLILFYFWQIFPIGGLHVALKQLDVFAYGIPGSSFLTAIQHEITARWGGEMFFMDGSLPAMTFRLVSYFAIFASAFFIRHEKAVRRRRFPRAFSHSRS